MGVVKGVAVNMMCATRVLAGATDKAQTNQLKKEINNIIVRVPNHVA